MREANAAAVITDPLEIGTLTLRNRLYRAPVLEGAGNRANAADIYARHFVKNAEHGVGLIIQGNTVVEPEGTTSPGMAGIKGRDDILRLAPMVDQVHEAGASIVIQLGHGGAWALESWNADYIARRSRPPVAPSLLPLWLRPAHTGVHVLSTDDVAALVARFGDVAEWTRDAGYDGVQLAGANAKLLHQFMSPTYNRRDDRYGGSIEARFRFIREIREAIGERAGWDYPVLLKMPGLEHAPIGGGIPLSDGVRLAELAEDAGFDAVTPAATDTLPNTVICRGSYPGRSFRDSKIADKLDGAAMSRRRFYSIAAGMWVSSKRYPFTPVWNRDIFSAVKAAVSIPVFAVGGIRTSSEAAGILASGAADAIGVGRPFYAQPELAAEFLAGDVTQTDCESCNQCIVPQMLGMPGICYNPAVNRKKRARREAN